MKKLVLVITFVMVAMLLVSGLVIAAPADKVDVCHIQGNDSYHLININQNAYDSHIAHGDATPGEPVPGNPGHVFGADCAPEAEPILVVSSIAFGFSGTGWAGWSCPANHTVVDGGVSKTNTQPFTPADYSVVQGPAKPGVTVSGSTYPIYPHYVYTPPEEGWVVQNGGTPQSLYIYVYCTE